MTVMSPPPLTESPRLRIARVDYRPGADGRGDVEVALEHGGRRWTGTGRGLMTREGDLRMGAEATLAAVDAATDESFRPVLGGVKALRAFDSWLVIVSVEVDDAGRHLRLLGAEAAESDNLVRGAVLAVLDALNRVLERHLAR
ncbi:MAG: hypothetical protein RLN75_09070 [Longimicrobiales bacterium]